jgi:hypothetical protein
VEPLWVKAEITSIQLPHVVNFPSSSGVVKIQEVQIDFPEDDWPWPVNLVICNWELPVENTTGEPQAECEDLGFETTHPSWGGVWSSLDPALQGGPVPSNTVYARGRFEAEASVHMVLRVQFAAPAGSAPLLRGFTEPFYDGILDNIGMGVQTFDGNLIDQTAGGVPIPSGRWEQLDASGNPFNPAVFTTAPRTQRLLHITAQPTPTFAWEVDTIGLTLPTDPVAGLRVTERVAESPNNPNVEDRLREVGTPVPSRIAYGRVLWDNLWTGTCVGGAHGGARALPELHPRVGRDGIVSANTCTGGGGVFQPTCPGVPGQEAHWIKYDFEEILDLRDTAYAGIGGAAVGVGATSGVPVFTGPSLEDVHPSQRISVRVMPYLDTSGGGPPYSHVGLPVWFAGCPNVGPPSTPCLGATCANGGDPVSWFGPTSEGYQSQVALLANALTGDTSHTAFLGGHTAINVATDHAVFSVDVGSVGFDGEWTIGNLFPSASLDSSSAPPTCRVPPLDYTVDESSWWADTIDAWSARLPVWNPATDALVHRPNLVGKFEYAASAFGPSPQPADKWQCVAAPEYVAGRRGTWPVDDGAGGYDLQLARGARYDAWLTRELNSEYWEESSRRTDEFTKATAVFPEAAEAWRRGSFQAEVWFQFEKSMSQAQDLRAVRRILPGLQMTEEYGQFSYGFWDLDEAIRFSTARHLSLFNWKRSEMPWLSAAPPPMAVPRPTQLLPPDWCACSPDPTGPCAANAMARLLETTGFRIRAIARARSHAGTWGGTLPVNIWLANRGNAPAYTPYQLQFALVRRSDFDPGGVQNVGWRAVETWPRPSRAPINNSLATLIEATTYPVGVNHIDGVQVHSSFDLRSVLPAIDIDPAIRADHASAACATGPNSREDINVCFSARRDAPQGGGGGFNNWSTASYPSSPGIPLPGWCAAVGCVVPPVPPQVASFPLRLPAQPQPAPMGPQTYVILYRFQDLTGEAPPAGAPREFERAFSVPLDMDTPRVVGDASTQRWHFLSYVEVQ